MDARLSTSTLALILAIGTLNAHAETVNVVVDVTATGRHITHLYPGGSTNTSDASFQPQTFQWLVSFDLSQPTIDAATAASGSLVAGTLFRTATTSVTPYTSSASQLFSVSPSALSAAGASAGATRSTSIASQPLNLPQLVTSSVSLTDGQTWRSESNGQVTITGYSRHINWLDTGEVLSNQAFHAWTGQEFVAYLLSQVGQVHTNAFSEGGWQDVMQPNAPADAIVAGTFAGPLVASDDAWVVGDATIRAVNVVPEPASWLLMALGLFALAWARRPSAQPCRTAAS